MILSDTVFLSDEMGTINIVIDDYGKTVFYSDSNRYVCIYVIIKSLDTNLTVNAMFVDCPIGYDMWTFGENFFLAGNMDFHPGLKIEIYNPRGKKLIEKYYHRDKRYKCISLRSNKDSFAHQSYHTFFNDRFFLDNLSIKDNDVVYDLGANIGAFSLACSNYNISKIYAFEPHAETFGYLCYNTERYGTNVTCFQKAICDDFKKVSFGGISSTCSLGYGIISDNDLKKDEVYGINLEQFVKANSLMLPSYLKIDIEGAEYSFFDSTSDSFFQNTHSIFFEFHRNDGSNLNSILNRFNNMGYRTIANCSLDVPQGTVYLVK